MHSGKAHYRGARIFSCASPFKPNNRLLRVKACIAQQQRVIVEPERTGSDCAEAKHLLEGFLLLQQSREEDRARILDELEST
jgi:hypothetical protein